MLGLRKARHPFQSIKAPTSLESLVALLRDNIVADHDGLYFLNKPYGLAARKSQELEEALSRHKTLVSPVMNEWDKFTLQDALPQLRQSLGVSHLVPIKFAERWSTGLTVLCSKPEAFDKYYKFVRRHLRSNVYWMVTIHPPHPSECVSENVGMKFEKVMRRENRVPVIQTEWTKSQVRSREVVVNCISYRTLSKQHEHGAALVEVNPQFIKHHFVKVFLVDRCAAVLGDSMYSNRMKLIHGGIPVKVDPHRAACESDQLYVPKAVSQDLLLPARVPVPVHFHHVETRLPSFFGKDKDLVVRAPPYPFFQWTCEQLNLKLPYVYPEDDENAQHIS